MRIVPGLSEDGGKGVLSSSFDTHVGDADISPLPQEGQYPPNSFLKISPFPFAFLPVIFREGLLCIKLSSKVSCSPSPGCDSRMFCWLCHGETLPFLRRNWMTIQLGGTATFQGSVSSPLFPCLTLPLRSLSFDCEFGTRKPI